MVKKTTKPIIIGHLYPKEMNVYGDMGNIITLRYRLEQRGYKVKYVPIESLADFDKLSVDILVGGGGQDSNQELIQNDLVKHSERLKNACNDGLVCLLICGMYQMFGAKFVLPNGEEIPGAGVVDLYTEAGNDRLIGNVVIESEFGELVGFENHSGRTYLGESLQPLGRVKAGYGNNASDGVEGVIDRNIFGTYMHGPALAKNPALADELIRRALILRGENVELAPLDDTLEHKAAEVAATRPQ